LERKQNPHDPTQRHATSILRTPPLPDPDHHPSTNLPATDIAPLPKGGKHQGEDENDTPGAPPGPGEVLMRRSLRVTLPLPASFSEGFSPSEWIVTRRALIVTAAATPHTNIRSQYMPSHPIEVNFETLTFYCQRCLTTQKRLVGQNNELQNVKPL